MKKLLHRDEKNTSFQHYTNIRRFCKNIPPKFRNKKVFLTLPTINNIIKLC
jgi:hypothetical protein